MESQIGIKEVVNIIKRRKKAFFLVFFILFPTVVIVALSLPAIYIAETTILRETQKISENYIRSLINEQAEERIDEATQMVMSRSNLNKIITKFNLYPEIGTGVVTGEMIAEMRKAINLQTMYARVTHERTGQPTAINTAFKLSFEGREPEKVQHVTNMLASLYIELDTQTRGQRATATTTFLENELKTLKESIRNYEEKIQKFKENHIGKLPENYSMNIRTLERLERDEDKVEDRIQTIEERMIFLEGQITTIDPLLPIKTREGKMANNPAERLKQLHLQLMRLQSQVSDKHPDIKRLKNEINDLEERVGKSDNAVLIIKRMKELEQKIAVSEGKLGQKHPDVIQMKKEIEKLSSEVDKVMTERVILDVSEEKSDNPTYINLRTQIFMAEAERKKLKEDKKDLSKSITEYMSRIERTPLVEKEFTELTRDYRSTKLKYDDISSKLMEAKVAQGLQAGDFGERFIIVEPAALPDKPYKPNRLSIIILGFIFAVGLGIALEFVIESMDQSIKSIDELNKITDYKVLSIISMIETDADRRGKRIKRLIWVVGFTGLIMVSLFVVNYWIVSIEEIWRIILLRIKEV